MNVKEDIDFYAPHLLISELNRYSTKISNYSKLSPAALLDIESSILSTITLVSEEEISKNSWLKAYDLAKDIDEDDTPFIALAIELNAVLWTGDKILTKGLIKKGSNIIITTSQLKKLIA